MEPATSEQMNDAPHHREDDEDPPQYGEFFFFLSLSACSRSSMAPHGGRVLGTISCDDF
jgi:hypothetical protein